MSSSRNFFVVAEACPSDMGQLESVLRSYGCRITLFVRRPCDPYRAYKTPFDPDQHDGLIILGSDEEGENWTKELGWIDVARGAKKPILGICQGAQLLAHYLRFGYCKKWKLKQFQNGIPHQGLVSLKPESTGETDALFKGFDESVRMYQWHKYFIEVNNSPHVSLIESCHRSKRHCEAFRIDDITNSYGLQFHPELYPDTIADWCNVDGVSKPSLQECIQASTQGRRLLETWVALALNESIHVPAANTPKV